jgi:hypothetical protein
VPPACSHTHHTPHTPHLQAYWRSHALVALRCGVNLALTQSSWRRCGQAHVSFEQRRAPGACIGCGGVRMDCTRRHAYAWCKAAGVPWLCRAHSWNLFSARTCHTLTMCSHSGCCNLQQPVPYTAWTTAVASLPLESGQRQAQSLPQHAQCLMHGAIMRGSSLHFVCEVF